MSYLGFFKRFVVATFAITLEQNETKDNEAMQKKNMIATQPNTNLNGRCRFHQANKCHFNSPQKWGLDIDGFGLNPSFLPFASRSFAQMHSINWMQISFLASECKFNLYKFLLLRTKAKCTEYKKQIRLPLTHSLTLASSRQARACTLDYSPHHTHVEYILLVPRHRKVTHLIFLPRAEKHGKVQKAMLHFGNAPTANRVVQKVGVQILKSSSGWIRDEFEVICFRTCFEESIGYDGIDYLRWGTTFVTLVLMHATWWRKCN